MCKLHPDFAQAPYHAGMILEELERYADAKRHSARVFGLHLIRPTRSSASAS